VGGFAPPNPLLRISELRSRCPHTKRDEQLLGELATRDGGTASQWPGQSTPLASGYQ